MKNLYKLAIDLGSRGEHEIARAPIMQYSEEIQLAVEHRPYSPMIPALCKCGLPTTLKKIAERNVANRHFSRSFAARCSSDRGCGRGVVIRAESDSPLFPVGSKLKVTTTSGPDEFHQAAIAEASAFFVTIDDAYKILRPEFVFESEIVRSA